MRGNAIGAARSISKSQNCLRRPAGTAASGSGAQQPAMCRLLYFIRTLRQLTEKGLAFNIRRDHSARGSVSLLLIVLLVVLPLVALSNIDLRLIST